MITSGLLKMALISCELGVSLYTSLPSTVTVWLGEEVPQFKRGIK